MMQRNALARFTAALIATVGALAIITAGVRGGSPADIEAARAVIIPTASIEAPVDDAVVAASEAEQASALVTTTTAPPTTVPPSTAPPTTAPPAPVAPPTTAPATVPPPPPAPPTTAAPTPPASSASFTACEQEMFDRMNQARTSRGIAALVGDGRVTPISRAWSDELARRQDLQHNPDYGPQTFAAVPEARRAAENVGRTHGSNASLFDAFMASQGHRDAILAPGNTHAGVGCTVDAGGQLWVAVNFWG